MLELIKQQAQTENDDTLTSNVAQNERKVVLQDKALNFNENLNNEFDDANQMELLNER